MPRAKPLPPQSELQKFWEYNFQTGLLTWKIGRNRGQVAGCKAYYKGRSKAIVVKLGAGNQTPAQAHRIIWKWVTGIDPFDTIDHVDLNPFNNSWSNLRNATMLQQNTNKRQNNRTGYKGVMPTPGGRFAAYITVNRKTKYLGSFDTPQQANAAYAFMAQKVHGSYSRGN